MAVRTWTDGGHGKSRGCLGAGEARRSVYPNESRNDNRAILGVSILRAPAGNATEPNSDRENV
jgi:hypothetical protein